MLHDRDRSASPQLTELIAAASELRLSSRFTASLEVLSQAEDLLQSVQDVLGTARCHVEKGKVYRDLSDWLHAERALRAALTIYEGLGQLKDAALTNIDIGIMHELSGKWEKAESAFDEALS